MIRSALFAAAVMVAGPALADGHVAEGEKLTAKRCKSCHMIVNGDDVILKGGKTGPNLWGVIGRQAGAEADFSRYGDDIVAAGAGGLVWDEANIAEFIADPKAFLRATLGDNKARSKMSLKVRKEEERAAIAAYLASLAAE